MGDRTPARTGSGTDTFTAWVAVLDTYAANLDAILAGDLDARVHVSTVGLGPLPRSLEVRATDLLTRTHVCEHQVEERMHELQQRSKLAARMKQSARPAERHLLDASS
jgi:hypothetical protein